MPGPHRKMMTQEGERYCERGGEGEGVAREAGRAERGGRGDGGERRALSHGLRNKLPTNLLWRPWDSFVIPFSR